METYEDKTNDSDDGHEDGATLSERKSEDLHERLRCIEGEESVEIGHAEQEEDRSRETEDTSSNATGQDALAGDNAIGTD